MKNCPYIPVIASFSSLLLICTPTFSTPASSNIPTPSVPTQTASDKVRQIAQSITVKVLVGNYRGSGILIAKKGQVYTILTNAHVVSRGNPYRIQTSDGKVYQANLIYQGDTSSDNDLVLLEFQAKDNYAVATVGNSSTLKENQVVFTAGFPFEQEQLIFTSGKITLIATKPLRGGYQIGYTNQTQQGMSGGPVLNEEGKLIGIVGQSAEPILNDAYIYQDRTIPTPRVMEKMRQSSFAVPIAKLTQIAPQLTEIIPNAENQKNPPQTTQYTGIVKEVDDIAQQITVKIDLRYSGNGSGVIVAKQGQTYYVLTANHVVDRDEAKPGCQLDTEQRTEEYHIVTPDGQRYPVNLEKMTCLEGVDLAVVSFTSGKTYTVANLAKYKVGSEGSQWIFVSGFPGTKTSNRLLTAGKAVKKEDAQENVQDIHSLTKHYGLYYTNASYRGMSGSPVLDRSGRVIGINTAAEDEIEIDQAGQMVELHLGYSLGVPIATFLSLASKTGVKTEDLKIENSLPAGLNSSEATSIENQLFSLKVPHSAFDWLNYGSQLQKLDRQEEAFAAFTQAIKLKPDFYQAYYARGLVLIDQPQVKAGLSWSISQKALADFKQATKLQPNFYQGWRRQSYTLTALSKYSEALAAIDKAIAIQPKDFNLYVQKAHVLWFLKRYQEELVAYNEALKINPSAKMYFYRAFRDELSLLLAKKVPFDKNKVIKVIANYTKAIELEPNSEHYQTRGRFYFLHLKDYDKAFADYTKAIELEPNGFNYRTRGKAYFELKDYDKAFADYTKAIELKPNGLNYRTRGDAYFELKNYDKAFADYTRAIEVAPSSYSYKIRGDAYFKLKEYKKAVADYTRAIEITPDSYSYKVRGDAYFKLKEYKKAVADYTQIIKVQPNNAESYNIRGDAYFQLKDYDKAFADYTKAIEVAPNDEPLFIRKVVTIKWDAYYRRGSAYLDIKNYEKSIADFTKAIEIEDVPESIVNVYSRRGKAYFQLKNYDKAFADYNKAIELRPDYDYLYVLRGDAYAKLKEYEKAIADFTQAIERMPEGLIDNPEMADRFSLVYLNRGLAYAALKDYGRAILDFSKVIEIKPNDVQYYYLRGRTYFQLKDYPRAIVDYSKVIELQSNDVESYRMRGLAYLVLKDYQKAIADYSKVIELQPNDVKTYETRGLAYLALKDYQKAIADYSKIIELQPNDVESYRTRGDAYLKVKDYQRAIVDYNKAIELQPNDFESYKMRGIAYFL
ncbi:tetratricopeptide repeat protein [Fischerella sp. PCC 9605]|uniref:tetratricopeptide repeat protein n=1 Tax=Fischerella sp. PCC 9605 TaxID=1173024 RepID=UPI00047B7D50|nr:tetratricopeptide repeat protein [Fischerella sp. PCC 9605]